MKNDQLKTIHVDLLERGYDIHIGTGLLSQAGTLLAPLLSRPRAAIVADAALSQSHHQTLSQALADENIEVATYIVPSGEASKSFAQLEDLCTWLLDQKLARGDLIIALGGGVIGDLTGFAASILKRGTRFAQIPTTLLAQVDSSVGGKTGINTAHGKNLIGAFHQPSIVLADVDVLATLSDRDYRAGYAEIIKYGVLGDASFFSWLETENQSILGHDTAALMHAIAQSCTMKADIVKRDERETGERALLNLGHTFAHAFEAHAGYDGKLLHGEAVALGMVLAVTYSARLGLCSDDAARRVSSLIAQAGLPTQISEIGTYHAADLIDAMAQDKKVVDGQLRLVLTRDIGQAFVAEHIDTSDLFAFLVDSGATDRPS